MAEFNKDHIEVFLGVVRKYMQVRGSLSQKDLAELTDTGVSTMSRFLNQKTTEFNPQLIAKIVAFLEIPLHEIIDFVEEDFADKFIRLVKFYKQDNKMNEEQEGETDQLLNVFSPGGGTFSSAQSVSISCSTSGSTIRYTTNGVDPTSSSPVYSGPISVSSGSVTIKARAFRSGWIDSNVAAAIFTTPKAATKFGNVFIA